MGEKYRNAEELIQIILGQYDRLDDHAYVDAEADVLTRKGKVLVTKTGKVEEASSKSGTFELQLLRYGNLQLKVYYSPDNWNTVTTEKLFLLLKPKIYLEKLKLLRACSQ